MWSRWKSEAQPGAWWRGEARRASWGRAPAENWENSLSSCWFEWAVGVRKSYGMLAGVWERWGGWVGD